LAIAYDTSLRPVDIRNLTSGQVKEDRLEIVQAKTGRPAHLPLWPETVQVIRDYLVTVGAVPLANAPLLRTPRGRPYTKDYLAKQVRKVLRKAGIPDGVQLRDIRRTASKERAEAGATEAELAAGTGHSIERGSQILDVYNPRSYTLAKSAQDKRRQRGQETEKATKV
jgi:Phage integrase family